MNPERENTFIIISGPPQKGKRERISRVRSHITSGYFRRRKQTLEASCKLLHARDSAFSSSPPPEQGNDLHRAFASNLPPEIPFTMLSVDHPMREPSFFLSETTRRMQKFFDLQLCANIHHQPIFRDMTTWALTIPHFTSAKLLSASGFDDLQDSGEFSPWTLRQRSIAIRLLDDVLRNEPNVHKGATIAAIQCLLGFEMLNGCGENYSRLRNFSKGINQGLNYTDNTWETLARYFFLLDQTNRLRAASDKSEKLSTAIFPDTVQFSFPVDFALFTFRQHCPLEDNSLTYGLLGELHNVLSIAKLSGEAQVAKSTHNYVASLWHNTHEEITRKASYDKTTPGVDENRRAACIRLCIFMLASHLLSDPDYLQKQSVPTLSYQLRELLDTTGMGLEQYTAWILLPGALLWCLAIGVRFSDQKNTRWFLVQFMRVSHPWLLSRLDEASKNICLVTTAVEKIQQMCVEEV